jgi:predicted DNA-binding protein with PD1-like motif
MKSAELFVGRTFQLVFEDGDSLLPVLKVFCREEGIRQAIIPSFIAGFAEVEIVGTCAPVDDVDAPLWDTTFIYRTEAFGAGTVVFDPDSGQLREHIHVSVGRKHQGAVGYTSHLKSAQVQFTAEMHLVEVLAPSMHRRIEAVGPYDVPLLGF